jgi:elongation factor G
VIGDIQRRRGQLVGMEDTGLSAEVEALVPLASLQSYTTCLRSMTQGRGSSTMELNGYAPAPTGIKRSMGPG